MTITENDVREGLGYAYFHAIVTHAGFACQTTARTIDAMAVDTFVVARERLAEDSKITNVLVQFQLKATSTVLPLNNGHYSFRIEREQYDKLREPAGIHAIPLVLMHLPENLTDWLDHDEDRLISKRCAYWVSLRNAPAVSTQKPTIYVPKANVFSADSLRALITRFSRLEEVDYGK